VHCLVVAATVICFLFLVLVIGGRGELCRVDFPVQGEGGGGIPVAAR
jgi:hypothetical protein